MSNQYPYYAEADQVPVLETQPLPLSAEDLDAIRALVSDSAIAVRAAHLYDRKGYFATDDFAGTPNPSYRRDGDDIVVQVSLVIRGDATDRDKYAALSDIYQRVQTAVEAEQVAARQAEVARAEADLAAAQARLDAARRG